jgi:ribosomal protein S27AE
MAALVQQDRMRCPRMSPKGLPCCAGVLMPFPEHGPVERYACGHCGLRFSLEDEHALRLAAARKARKPKPSPETQGGLL